MKIKKDAIIMEGVVEKVLRDEVFRVVIEGGHIVTARVSGKMRVNSVRILMGDRVSVELSPYDLTRGRIILRHKF